ncbi:MAG: cytochrome c1 [Woeseiaceae bacterium]|nr:cytochrome c1 [Woeseiaceae bacterium]
MKSVLTLITLLASAAALSATDIELLDAGNDPDNQESLQRGARNFMNYCSGCHSAKYVRYNTVARGLGINEDQVIRNLMFNAEKMHETIERAMPDGPSARWFGTSPPDLSLIARSKSPDYIYSFLKGFYIEDGSPTGVNNLYLAGTSMPHVLWELDGFKRAVFIEGEENSEGVRPQIFQEFQEEIPGTMSAEEYDAFVRDTVNFLEYIAEPVRSTRRILGVWVLIYLGFFLIIAIMLKKQIWKDVPKN